MLQTCLLLNWPSSEEAMEYAGAQKDEVRQSGLANTLTELAIVACA